MSDSERNLQGPEPEEDRTALEGPAKSRAPAKLPAWKMVLFSALPTVLLFVVLEVTLMLLGVEPQLLRRDPFVGFVSNIPLFVEKSDPAGGAMMVTNQNKLSFFNMQRFPREKKPGTYRIFCLGGSTTYGRPYPDETSFCGWLRELLPTADASRRWEVVNAGGISYASYRVARLMRELVDYEPNLFIVYSGHNEFLEERTYGSLRDLPGPVKSVVGLLARTRTWTALGSLLRRLRPSPKKASDNRHLLHSEVRAKLDYSAGPERYKRDDALREKVITHFRFSLLRMVELARSVDAEILFITPASNLKDFSPFKSQHSDDLEESESARSEMLRDVARERMKQSKWKAALEALDQAVSIDPRLAELHYLRGKTLLALGRYDKAKASLVSARDEDVVPLRALSSMQESVAEAALKSNAPLVDFVGLLEQWSRMEGGHGVVGKEYFLDHVHPSIEVHRRLALELIELMAEKGIVRPSPVWGAAAIAEVAKRVEKSLAPEVHARALANLSMTLDWAGKQEEALRLAFKTIDFGLEHPVILAMVGRHFALEGNGKEALRYYRRAVRADPNDSKIHEQIGLLLTGLQRLEAAAAHLFLASLLDKDNSLFHKQLGYIMAKRGRFKAALTSYLQASRLDPRNKSIDARIASVRTQLGDDELEIDPPRIYVARYESGYPETIAQTRPDASGRLVPDGIWTEWHDGGELKRFVDYEGGVPHGVSVSWDEDGRIVERNVFRRGVMVGDLQPKK